MTHMEEFLVVFDDEEEQQQQSKDQKNSQRRKEGKKMFSMREVRVPIVRIYGCRDIKKEEIMAIKNRFPSKIPVIIQKYEKDPHLPVLDKSKFLIPADISMCHFQSILRKRLRMSKTQALYLLVNDKSMMSLSLTIEEIYREHAQPNGFLHITYASQEAFGTTDSDSERIQICPEIDEVSSASVLLR